MKKLITIISLFFVLSTLKTNAQQIYSPSYAGYVGRGTIYYPFGFYQGEIYNGYANGVGMFYRLDGSFYYGGFYAGLYSGAGFLMVKGMGYVQGCWQNGVFAGACLNGYNPNAVQNIVAQVQNTVAQVPKTDTTNYKFSPEGYKITEIDPQSEAGQSILGGVR